MAKPISATKGPRKHPGGLQKQIQALPIEVIKEKRVNMGMITSMDSADIPTGAVVKAKNCRIRFDRIEVRPGTKVFDPPKPDSNPVLDLYLFEMYDNSRFIFRFTPSTIHELDPGVSWIPYAAGAGGSLTGGPTDRFDIITAFNRCFFANGVDPVQELDTVAKQYKGYGNAPTWKYITAFADRVFGANLVASTIAVVDVPPNPVYIGWSGAEDSAGGIDEWDPSVEETSGRQPLLETPGDLSDDITGLFAFTNYLVVLRERSVWLGTKQAIPQFPVRFFAAWPGFGCDCPSSAQVCEQSMIWLDTRTRTVWQYPPNGSPVRIGAAVEETILDGLSDPLTVFSGYDPIENEYYVGYPVASSDYSRIWCYNIRSQAWTYDEIRKATTIASLSVPDFGGVTIDELLGTIDGLVGTIDSLSPESPSHQQVLWGRNDGDIVVADETIAEDYVDSTGGEGLLVEIDSKDFEFDSSDTAVNCFRMELERLVGNEVGAFYNKNNRGFLPYTTFTFVPSDNRVPRIFNSKKNVRARRYGFRIASSICRFKVLSYEIHATKAGMSRQTLGNTTT
jgi:hypothetical protein